MDGAGGFRNAGSIPRRYLNPSNGNSFYRSNELISPEPQPNQQVLSMLQSISVTLSDVQGQLAIIQEQNEQRDSTLNRLEGDIKTLKRKNEAPQADTPKSKRHRKSPCGLSLCVRTLHSSFEDEDQYRADERVDSAHNKAVTDKITKDVINDGSYKEHSDIAYAAKKYHEYLVRQQKPQTADQKKKNAKNNRIIQRRQRLYERRKKCATGQEITVMQSLSEKYMTDEETDSDDDTTLVKRSLPWRSTKCDRFLKTLDDRYVESREKKSNSKPLKPRKIGPNSERSVPKNAVNWAILCLNDQSLSPNGENQQNASPSTPNTSFTNPGPSSISTPLSPSLVSMPLSSSTPSLVSTPLSSSAPSLVSTPQNSAAGSVASSSPSELNDDVDNDESDLEGWIRSVAGMTSLDN